MARIEKAAQQGMGANDRREALFEAAMGRAGGSELGHVIGHQSGGGRGGATRLALSLPGAELRRVGADRLSAEAVRLILREHALEAGYRDGRITPHSLRAG